MRTSWKNCKSKVNDGRTPASLRWLDVLDEPNRLSLPASQSELIWKRSTGVSPAGGGGDEGDRGGGGVKQRIESQEWTYPSVLARSYCTHRAKSTEPASESIGVDLELFARGLPWRLEKH